MCLWQLFLRIHGHYLFLLKISFVYFWMIFWDKWILVSVEGAFNFSSENWSRKTLLKIYLRFISSVDWSILIEIFWSQKIVLINFNLNTDLKLESKKTRVIIMNGNKHCIKLSIISFQFIEHHILCVKTVEESGSQMKNKWQ